MGRRDPRVELAERSRPARWCTRVAARRPRRTPEDVLEVGGATAPRPRAVVEQHAVGEEAAERGLELVVVRVDEARHHDLPRASISPRRRRAGWGRPRRSSCPRPARRPREIANLRIHRHHRAAADDVAPARPAAVLGGSRRSCRSPRPGARTGRARPRPTPVAAEPSGNRAVELRESVVLRNSLIAQDAHSWSPPQGEVARCADSSVHSGSETALL